MTLWFGAPWNPNCCRPGDRVDPPTTPCLRCELPFGADDQGVVMPLVARDRSVTVRGWHLDCHLESLGLPTGIRQGDLSLPRCPTCKAELAASDAPCPSDEFEPPHRHVACNAPTHEPIRWCVFRRQHG